MIISEFEIRVFEIFDTWFAVAKEQNKKSEEIKYTFGQIQGEAGKEFVEINNIIFDVSYNIKIAMQDKAYIKNSIDEAKALREIIKEMKEK